MLLKYIDPMRILPFLLLAVCTTQLAHAQLIKDSLLVDGHYRSFLFNKPQTGSSGSSLVFVIHGSGGKPEHMMKQTVKLESMSQTEKFIVVYPAGYKNYWNECRKASTAAANVENIDENAFFNDMIRYFKTKYQINEKQVFVSGFSGGGHMAYKLAMTMPDEVRAISAIVANMPTPDNMDCPELKIPVATMITNGTSDPLNLYNGGHMISGGVTLGNVRSTDESFGYWTKLNGFKGTPVKENMPDADPGNGVTIESYTFRAKNKPEVRLLKVINGKHEFPTDIDIFVESWAFFKRQI
ncbi:alpha/beta hydrolase family esterase [Dyadobacter bucti]|uniref:alpha/beta hydrolase family esterase n=1 Tax=Dyadobacter bucti TaxID=2572203 RepID=UPI003F700010